MFRGCSALQSLDLSNFDTSNLEITASMFSQMSKLTTIYVGSQWTTNNISSRNSNSSMFDGCTNLKGGAGTDFNPAIVDKTYAHIDGGSDNPGYLTGTYSLEMTENEHGTVSASKTENIISGRTVTLTAFPNEGYSIRKIIVDGGEVDVTKNNDGTYSFTMPKKDVTVSAEFALKNKCIFDEDTKTLYLRGEVVKSDVKNYLKSGVLHVIAETGTVLPADCSTLFMDFASVQDIDLSNADTSNVINMANMFCNGISLTSINLSSFSMDSMSSVNKPSVSYMFYGCSWLKTIYVSNQWDIQNQNDSISSVKMFGGCSQLAGGNGTAFNSTVVDKTYAVIDKDGQPGYLTGTYSLKLPENMLIVTDASADKKVGKRYLNGAQVKIKTKYGYYVSGNVSDDYTTYAPDENDIYTITVNDDMNIRATVKEITYTLVPAVAPTYTTDGNIEYYSGSDGKYYVLENDKYVKTTREAVTIPMLELVHHEAVAATCTTDGNIEYWHDETNDKYFSDENGTTEISQTRTVIQATGHTPAEAVRENEVAAAYTAEGSYDLVVYCSECHEELSRETVTVPMLEKTEVIINSVDINGITTSTPVYAETYTNEDYTVPQDIYLDGYTFIGWKVNNGETISTPEAVQTAVYELVKAETEVTVEVVYTKKTDTYTVNVDVGGAFSDGSSEERAFNVSDIVTVIADKESPEQAFTCWKRGDQIVSYDKTYSFFMPNENITLTAIYTGGVEQQGIAFIEKVDSDKENGTMIFVSICNVPQSCKMKKAGLIADLDKDKLSSSDTARFKKLSDKVTEDTKNLKYTWSVSGANDNTVLYVRSYLVYEDANGETHELFGDVVEASLKAWRTIIKDEVVE